MENISEHRKLIWNNFCNKFDILKSGVDLFDCDQTRTVTTFNHGRHRVRLLLKRSEAMEKFLISEVNKVLLDFKNNSHIYDGLIYMMYRVENSHIIPLYIGKSEKFGKGQNNLSENIRNIEKNKDKFCRWGYNNAYHFGDLSAAVLGHSESSKIIKYESWAKSLFEEYPTNNPRLKYDIKFWIKAWKPTDIGIWEEFGPTNLTFLEYLLIGVASSLFPNDLLNKEGVNRGFKINESI